MTSEYIDAKLADLLSLNHGLSLPELDYVLEMDSMRLAGRWLNWQVKARIHELWKDHCGERKER